MSGRKSWKREGLRDRMMNQEYLLPDGRSVKFKDMTQDDIAALDKERRRKRAGKLLDAA